jgi:predicted TIM-barrel fold metal-dependent hydrolase
MQSRVVAAAAAVMVLAGASRALAQEGRPAPIAPLFDAHQHVRSPAAAAHASDPVRPTITLPAELGALLAARVRAERDRAALRALYVDSAAFLESFGPSVIRGRDEIAPWWVGNTDSPYALDPVAYALHGSAAYVASYLRDGKTKHIDAHVLHTLVRGDDGRWRILTETLTMGGPRLLAPITADSVVALLDSAGIRRAAVLSIAYQFAQGRTAKPDEYPAVRAENDWTAAQVASHPDRLIAFCSVNPLRAWALEEVERCAASGRFRGLKLHMGNSGVDFSDTADVARLRRVFGAANARHLAIVIHLAPWGTPYGRAAAEAFLRDVLPAAPDVPVQVAHLASPGHLDPASDSALAVLASAVAAGDPRTAHLWFDVATSVPRTISRADARHVADRLRQIGLGRILYGTDTASEDNLPPREAWATIELALPLTSDELRTIARNVPPYAR